MDRLGFSPPLALSARPSSIVDSVARSTCVYNRTYSVRTPIHASSSQIKTAADVFVDAVKFDSTGLVAAVAQQWDTNEVLMVAWMNELAIRTTVIEGRAVYWSRSRGRLWRKGEESGNVQTIKDLRIDCDGDTILLLVDQIGPACHTGRRSCFYKSLDGTELKSIMEPLRDPKEMYENPKKH